MIGEVRLLAGAYASVVFVPRVWRVFLIWLRGQDNEAAFRWEADRRDFKTSLRHRRQSTHDVRLAEPFWNTHWNTSIF